MTDWTLCATTPNTGVPVGEFVWYRTLKLPSHMIHIETIDSLPRTGEWRRPGTDAPVIVINGDDGSERDEPRYEALGFALLAEKRSELASSRAHAGRLAAEVKALHHERAGLKIELSVADAKRASAELELSQQSKSRGTCHRDEAVALTCERLRYSIGQRLDPSVPHKWSECLATLAASSSNPSDPGYTPWRGVVHWAFMAGRESMAPADQLRTKERVRGELFGSGFDLSRDPTAHLDFSAIVGRQARGELFDGLPSTPTPRMDGGQCPASLPDDKLDEWLRDTYHLVSHVPCRTCGHLPPPPPPILDTMNAAELQRCIADNTGGDRVGRAWVRICTAELDRRLARMDADPTVFAPLDDPRMGGRRWIDADDITQWMLDAWPGLWECSNDDWGAMTYDDGARMVPGEMAGWWRPLRLPGMGLDGVVPGDKVTQVHLDRCRWGVRVYDGTEYEQENYTIDDAGALDDRWRPVGWPTDTADQQRTKRVRDRVMAELAEK